MDNKIREEAMSERITDERVQAIIDIYNDIIDRFGDCWKSSWESDIAAALTELLDRRATEHGTLRDEIAMRVIGHVYAVNQFDSGPMGRIEGQVRHAYQIADAMLAARAKDTKGL